MYKRGPGSRFKLGIEAAAIAVLALVTVACSSCGSPSFSPEVVQEIEQALNEVMEEFNIPGAVVGVWVPGEGELALSAGKADIETGRDIQASDKMRIGSITKTFTATVILQLVDEGLLGLEDTLDKFVAGVPGGDKITVRMLCSNTSGLYNYGEDENLVAALEEDPHRVWTPRELVDIAVSHDPYFAPGEAWRYSNTNFILLGMIVEEVTGSGYEDEVKKRIIEPLNLSSTSVAEGPEMTGEYSRGYEQAAEGSEELVDRTAYLDQSIVWASGAMVSDLEDLKTWARALAGGELLSEAAHKEQLTWVEISEEAGIEQKYGLGVYYIGGLIGHDGRQPGYDAAMFYLPSREATFVVLLNKAEVSNVALGVLMRITKVVLPGEVPW